MQKEPLWEAYQGVRQPSCVGSRADGGRYCTGEGVGEGREVGVEEEGVGEEREWGEERKWGRGRWEEGRE